MNGKRTSLNSETDWTALDAMTDDDLDTSDIPPIPLKRFAQAMVKRGTPPIQTNPATQHIKNQDLGGR